MLSEAVLLNARILVIDDETPNVMLLERMLQRFGYANLRTTTDPRDVLALFQEFQPDLILLDLLMPYMNGLAVMEQLMALIPSGDYLPIVVLTADITAQARQRSLAAGAKDFLTKPFDVSEVLLRIRNLLETRFLHIQLQKQNSILEARVRERTRDLEESQAEIIRRLARAAEFRDDETGRHPQRVGRLAALLAYAVGAPADLVELIGQAAQLHDLGKIGIPDHILLKADQLSIKEFEQMKSHTTIGARILMGSRFPLLRLAEEIALTHHERWDGTGYPGKLQGKAIPLAGRIVAVADAFDTITHRRPYREALPLEKAVAEIRLQSRKQFDPQIVEAFLELYASGVLVETEALVQD